MKFSIFNINSINLKQKIFIILFLTGFFFFFKKILIFLSLILNFYLLGDINYDFLFFTIFTFLSLFSSIMIFIPKNPVHSVLYMILTFVQVSFLMLIAGAEFISLIFIIVYVGAIAMLFLFIVMMLDLKKDNIFILLKNEISVYNYWGGGLFFLLIIEFYFLVKDSFNKLRISALEPSVYTKTLSNSLELEQREVFFFNKSLDSIGYFLYTYYFVYLIIIGIVLLIPLIAAIVLTFDHQNVYLRKKNLYRLKKNV